MENTAQKLKSNRDGFGDGIVIVAEKNPNILVLTADLKDSTKVTEFARKFPERFIEVGVAEQNMAGIAAGLALNGKIPVMTSYAIFNPGRNWEQIRTSIAYSKANVKIIGSHSGLSAGGDGATHQALEDIALMRVLPNLVVLSPCDYDQAKKATLAMFDIDSPVYMRLTRDDTPSITTSDTSFVLGKAQTLVTGNDVTIFTHGPITHEALQAADILSRKKNIGVEIINLHTIKPLDVNAIVMSARKTGKIVIVEEHQIAGGLGSAVCEILAQHFPVPVCLIGVNDTFGESGTYTELKHKHGLDAQAIYSKVVSFIENL